MRPITIKNWKYIDVIVLMSNRHIFVSKKVWNKFSPNWGIWVTTLQLIQKHYWQEVYKALLIDKADVNLQQYKALCLFRLNLTLWTTSMNPIWLDNNRLLKRYNPAIVREGVYDEDCIQRIGQLLGV